MILSIARLLYLLAATSIAAAAAAAAQKEPGPQPQAPIIVHSTNDQDPCGNGIVAGLDPGGDGFLAVKAGPGLRYRRIDKLYNGEQVYICVEAGEWYGVIYSRRRQDCNVMTPWPRSLPYTGPCRSGWVHKRWIEATAG